MQARVARASDSMSILASKDPLPASSVVMRIIGWSCVAVPALLLIYPPGFWWGAHPQASCFVGPAHGPSYLEGLHPYLFMLLALDLGYEIVLFHGARDPLGNAALFDFGVVANLLHAFVMLPQVVPVPTRGRDDCSKVSEKPRRMEAKRGI